MDNDVYSQIKSKINDLANSIRQDGFTQAEFEEVVIIVSAYPEKFPKRFQNLLLEFDGKNFPTRSEQRTKLASRLLKILQTVESLPEDRRDIDGNLKIDQNDALVPQFVLPKKDRERVAELCKKMREIIFSTPDFDEPHRRRLLNRIAAIEAEIHKPKGTFDVVRGGINDLGETLGKFGKDIKPLTKRMNEVVSIARKGTKEYDQIPPPNDVKQLPAPDSDDEE